MTPAFQGAWERRRSAALLLTIALCSAGCGKDAGAALPAGSATGAAVAASARELPADVRIVAVGGAVTEIAFALGVGPRIVAADTSSTYPAQAAALPKVGYQRTLAAEGIARERPTLLLLSAEAGPPAVIEQLRGLGVAMHIVPAEASVEGAKQKIRKVAEALGEGSRGEALVADLTAELAQAEARVRRATTKPRVLFVYARGAGTMMVSGVRTPAAEMIRLAGGENAVEGFEGFKPLTAEAASAARPDVILIPALGLESIGGAAGLSAQPGIAQTPAGRAGRVVAMDDLLLLGFGPRLGRAVDELATRIHPELAGRNP
ncbi:MAG: ABC transporter substrate-binding protein [Minicystis sp.]